jgi:hypothetical protein
MGGFLWCGGSEFAIPCGRAGSELLNQSHTSKL